MQYAVRNILSLFCVTAVSCYPVNHLTDCHVADVASDSSCLRCEVLTVEFNMVQVFRNVILLLG
jgi:hypothetical protein